MFENSGQSWCLAVREIYLRFRALVGIEDLRHNNDGRQVTDARTASTPLLEVSSCHHRGCPTSRNAAGTEASAIEQWLEKEDSNKYQHVGADHRQENQNDEWRS
jgi:hypothetical protein